MALPDTQKEFDPDAIKLGLLKAWEPSSEALQSIHPEDRMTIDGTHIGSPSSPALINACAQFLAKFPNDHSEILDIAKELIGTYLRKRCEIRRGGIPPTIDAEIDAAFARFLEEVTSSKPELALAAPQPDALRTDISDRVQKLL